MRLLFHHLVETPDSLEVGSIAGELVLEDDGYWVEFEDEGLGERVVGLIEEDRLRLRTRGASGATSYEPVKIGSPEWVTALFETLQRKDFRLQGTVLEE